MIRKVERNDIDECVSVIRNSFRTVADMLGFTEENAPRFTAFATTAERLNAQLDEGRPMFAYTDESGAIIGYYSLWQHDGDRCELNNLCVLPQERHSGVGRELFEHSAATARALGCKYLDIGIVEENTTLKAWYEKLGAKHLGTKKFDFFPFTCGYMETEL